MTGFANLSPRDGEIYNEGLEEGRAESEAQIAALQSEKDALREALGNLIEIESRDNAGDPDRIATDTWRNKVWITARLLLSAPASGEPARKP